MFVYIWLGSVNFHHAKNKRKPGSTSVEVLCSDAEKELAAFARAVQELLGPEQARQAIEDWMEELQSMDWRSQDTVNDWRGLTIAAAVRLASRVNGLPQRKTVCSERVSKA